MQAIRQHRLPNADIEHGHRSAALCHFANISYRVGNKLLMIDEKTEQFINSEDANALLKREYRKPFVIADPV